MEARHMCGECPLQQYDVSDLKIITTWGELALCPEQKERILDEARHAWAECRPDSHPITTAIAECFERHETGECPRVG